MKDPNLDELENKIHKLQDKIKDVPIKKSMSGLSLAVNVALEMFSAITIGALIGYLLDKYFGTKVIFLAIFLIIGTVAGVLNLYRMMKRYEEKEKK